MRKIKLFLSLLMVMIVSVGNVWAATSVTGTYKKVTSTTGIAAGDTVLLVNNAGTYALTGITSSGTKYGTRQEVTSNNGIISLSNADVEELIVEAGSASGSFSFKGTGDISGYLQYTGSSNTMQSNATKAANTSWTLNSYNATNGMTIANKNSTTRIIRYNTASGQERFACYTSSTGTLVNLYKKVYAVKYDKNGGDGTITDSDSPYDRNSNVTIKNNSFTPPTGKVFSTWNTKANGTGTNYAEGATISSIKKDVTLYAIWADASCTNKVNITKGTPEGGSFNLSKTGEQNCCSELVVNVTDISATTGKRFKQITQTGLTSGVTIDQVNKTVTYAAGTSGASTINVEFETIPSHNIIFSINGGTCETSSVSVQEGQTYSTLPTVTGLTSTCEYGTFVGWTSDETISGGAKPTMVTSVTMSTTDVNLYAVYSKTEGGSTPVEDELTPSVISNPTNYGAWSGKTASSDAVYAGYSTGGTSYIQLRISDNTSGIVSTTSGGNCSKITVDWNNTTTTSRYVEVYGKNSAYASSADLYDNSKAGTLIGTLSKDNGDTELEISGDYAYIGIRSQTGAIYLNSVTFTWGGGGTTTYSLDANCCTPRAITASGVGGELTLAPNLTEACAGTEITLTANTPDGSHQGTGTIKVVKTGVSPEENVTADVYSAGTLTMPDYAITITATYAEKSTPSVSVTPVALDFGSPKKGDNVDAMTFTLTGSALEAGTLTLVAPEGFTLSENEIAVSAGSLSATEIAVTPSTENAGTFNGNISISGAGVSSTNIVSLSMTVQATYTVNWYVNGTKIDANSITDIVGTAVTAPSDFSAFTDCQDLTFVGWKEGSAIDGGSTTEAPSLAEVVTTIPAANKDYYAVFAEGTPGSAQWEKATSVAAGEYLIVYETGGVAFDGSLSTLDAVGNTIAVTINDSKIAYSNATEAAKFTIAAKTGGYSIKSASNLYIGQTSDANGLVTSATDDYANAISISGGNADIVCSSAYLRYNSADNQQRFRYYKSTSYSGQKAIQLYKKNVSPANFTKWYTTCPHCNSVTLSKAGESAGNTFALQRNSADVTSVNTCEAVTVDVVASPATGYELTNLEVSGVTGASVNTEFTQISIPQDAEGTLTVTATFSQKNYSVVMAQWPTNAGATLNDNITNAHYGQEITISTNEPTGYRFSGWSIYNEDDVDLEDDIASEIFTGDYAQYEYAKEAKFLMPAKNIVAEADFNRVYSVSEFAALSKENGEYYYVEGLVSSISGYYSSKYITYFISEDGYESGSTIKMYNGLGLNGANFSSASDLTVGDKVVVYGQWSTNHSSFNQGNYLISHTALELQSVEVSGSADKTDYFAGEIFQFEGLSARAIYNTGYQRDVTAAATWKANGEASYTVSASGDVNVTAAYGDKTSENYPVAVTVTTKTLVSIELSETALTGYKGVALPKPTTVTAHFDDQGVASESNVTALAVYDEAGYYDASSTSEQTIQVKYTFGSNPRTADYTVTLSSIANTLNTAYSAEKAREIIDLDRVAGNDLNLADADNKVYVVGRITAKTNNEITIKDDADETKVLYLWQYDYGTGITNVEVGDLIKAYGNLYYHAQSGKYELNVGCEIVWKQPKVSIEISNQTMEVGETLTIADVATIDPAEAPVSYAIVANDDNCITLNESTGLITAVAEGTATVSISANDYEEYLANSKTFTVTVKPAAVHTSVVILAEYGGHYYALNNAAGTTEVQMRGGKVVVADEATKNAIVWDRAESGGVATFYNATVSKYLNGGTSTTLSVVASEGEYTSWNWVETATKAYYTSNPNASARTFLYQSGQGIKNYAASNIGNSSYAQPIMYTGEIVVGEITTLRDNLFDGKWGTYCPAQTVIVPEGASFYTLTYKEDQAGVPYKVFFDEIAEGASLEAGKPYLFIAEGETITGIKIGEPTTTVHPYNGFIGVLDNAKTHLTVTAQDEADHKYYIIYGNEIRLCGEGSFNVPVERAYLDMSQMSATPVAQMPGRRRVALMNNAPQVATGMDALNASDAPVKVLINGQLFIIRGEKMFDAKGQLVK